jgi:hypothetical protein
VSTPNQYRRAAALSVRIARSSSRVTSNPLPPRMPTWMTRGHGIGASVHLVTRHHARR